MKDKGDALFSVMRDCYRDFLVNTFLLWNY